MGKLKLKVITPEKILIEEDEIDAIYSTAIDGEFGVMAGHIPFMTPLSVGTSKYTKDNEENFISTIGGIFQIKDNEVLILTDCAEHGEEIDIARARSAKERAEARLGIGKRDIDTRRAQIALARATARIKAASKAKL